MARSNRRDVVESEGDKRSVLERLRPRTAKVNSARRPPEETSAAGRNDSFTADRLLDKWAVEERTSLDITTIYRKIKIGTFPAPLRVGLRRVAWRESDVAAWQNNLVVGVSRG